MFYINNNKTFRSMKAEEHIKWINENRNTISKFIRKFISDPIETELILKQVIETVKNDETVTTQSSPIKIKTTLYTVTRITIIQYRTAQKQPEIINKINNTQIITNRNRL